MEAQTHHYINNIIPGWIQNLNFLVSDVAFTFWSVDTTFLAADAIGAAFVDGWTRFKSETFRRRLEEGEPFAFAFFTTDLQTVFAAGSVMDVKHAAFAFALDVANRVLTATNDNMIRSNFTCRTRIVGKGGLWVMLFIYKYKTSTIYPLYETTQHLVLINK